MNLRVFACKRNIVPGDWRSRIHWLNIWALHQLERVAHRTSSHPFTLIIRWPPYVTALIPSTMVFDRHLHLKNAVSYALNFDPEEIPVPQRWAIREDKLVTMKVRI